LIEFYGETATYKEGTFYLISLDQSIQLGRRSFFEHYYYEIFSDFYSTYTMRSNMVRYYYNLYLYILKYNYNIFKTLPDTKDSTKKEYTYLKKELKKRAKNALKTIEEERTLMMTPWKPIDL
jgi:hypothetical protein